MDGYNGVCIERGRVEKTENGRYRVISVTNDGIRTLPLKAMEAGGTIAPGDLVYFFIFPDGEGLILGKA